MFSAINWDKTNEIFTEGHYLCTVSSEGRKRRRKKEREARQSQIRTNHFTSSCAKDPPPQDSVLPFLPTSTKENKDALLTRHSKKLCDNLREEMVNEENLRNSEAATATAAADYSSSVFCGLSRAEVMSLLANKLAAAAVTDPKGNRQHYRAALVVKQFSRMGKSNVFGRLGEETERRIVSRLRERREDVRKRRLAREAYFAQHQKYRESIAVILGNTNLPRSNKDLSIYSLVSPSRPSSVSHKPSHSHSPFSCNNSPEPSLTEQQRLRTENIKTLLRRPIRTNSSLPSQSSEYSDPTSQSQLDPPPPPTLVVPPLVTSSFNESSNYNDMSLRMRMRRDDVINLPVLANNCEPVLLEKSRTVQKRTVSGEQGQSKSEREADGLITNVNVGVHL